MSEVSERYKRLAGAFAEKIAAVPADRWSSPSPCPEWSARDIVGHVVSTQGMFLGFIGEKVGNIPSVDDDPPAAWAAASTAVQDALDDPERAATEFDGLSGRMTFETGVERFLCFDLVVHGWDLARAAGLDDRIRPDDVAWLWEGAKAFGPGMRSPRAFGPEVEPPEGADEQDRVLAFLGRRAAGDR